MEDIMAKTKKFGKRESESYGWATTKATKSQWDLVGIAIGAFVRKYPVHWLNFQKQLSEGRSKYNLATKDNKELRQANWRNTASFPIIYNAKGEEIDALLPTLEKIIPKLTHKNSINYVPFLKKYKIFLPAEKY